MIMQIVTLFEFGNCLSVGSSMWIPHKLEFTESLDGTWTPILFLS